MPELREEVEASKGEDAVRTDAMENGDDPKVSQSFDKRRCIWSGTESSKSAVKRRHDVKEKDKQYGNKSFEKEMKANQQKLEALI